MKVTIKGVASAKIEYEEITDTSTLEDLDGIEIDDEFVEYAQYLSCFDKLIEGYTKFEFKDNSLWAVCTYEVKEKLTEKELKELANYTQGQWSDGIGENFEQWPCAYTHNNDIYVSPWESTQRLFVSHEDISLIIEPSTNH